MGMPGQERVIRVGREEWFEEGRNPATASVEEALLRKYGTPTRKQEAGGRRYFTWAYDPSGRLVTQTSPLFNQCTGDPDPDSGINLSPECGTIVSAIVFPKAHNPDLSGFIQVGVIDAAGGYEALMATERGLEQLDAQRRARQLDDASRNAEAPQL